MKKIGLLVLTSFCIASGPFANVAKSSSVKKTAQAKKAKKNSKTLTEVIVPAKEPEVVVNSESTNFEALVMAKDVAARRPAGFTATARVISLRRELGLTRAEADAAPQDIILNAGFKEGISQGMVLKAARKVPVLDPYNDNQQNEITIQFASLKVMHVEDEVSIARIEQIDPIRSGMGIGVRGILVGDYVGN